MILGIGIDIIEIERIRNLVKKKNAFLQRFFTLKENKYFNMNGNIKMESVAGYFASKEAVVKSIGTGFSGISWQDIEIQKTSLGQPKVVLRGGAASKAKEMGIESIMLSISHCKTYAVAQAVAIGKDIMNH